MLPSGGIFHICRVPVGQRQWCEAAGCGSELFLPSGSLPDACRPGVAPARGCNRRLSTPGTAESWLWPGLSRVTPYCARHPGFGLLPNVCVTFVSKAWTLAGSGCSLPENAMTEGQVIVPGAAGPGSGAGHPDMGPEPPAPGHTRLHRCLQPVLKLTAHGQA